MFSPFINYHKNVYAYEMRMNIITMIYSHLPNMTKALYTINVVHRKYHLLFNQNT